MQTTEFLRPLGMDPEGIDLLTMTNLFLAQMRIGLYGGHSTILMLPTYLTPLGEPTKDKPVAVVEVNSEEIRAALITLTDLGPVTAAESSFPVPGGDYPAPWDDLIFGVAELLEPLARKASCICFCTPFPVQFSKDGEGTLLRLPESLKISGWEGKGLRSALTAELNRRGIQVPVIPVSSAAAVLMNGQIVSPGQSRYLGLIWDNGADVAFSAPGSAILKLKGDAPAGLTLVDTASGSFTGVPCGTVDLYLDRDSKASGEDLYTKMISSNHLGDIYRFTMIKAVEADLLTFGCGRDFLSLTKLDLDTVEAFLREPEGENRLAVFCREPADRQLALDTARAIFDRTARLVCANLTAALALTGAGKDPDKPAYLCASGRALQVPLIRSLLTEHLQRFTAGQLGLHCVLQPADNAVLTGGAAVALLNLPS